MANKSNWKGLEKDVATALGGIRRLRTTESYGKKADDVTFSKEFRKKHPIVKTVSIECKKKISVSLPKDYVVARSKYCFGNGKRLIFVSKKPATGDGWKVVRAKIAKARKIPPESIKREDIIDTLVTIDIRFFKELWETYLEAKRGDR